MTNAPNGSPTGPLDSGSGTRGGWMRQGAIAILCVAAVVVFAIFVDGIYPVKTWLGTRVLLLWGSVAVLHLSCLCLGMLVMVKGLGVRERPAVETLAVSMAVGVVSWVLLMYAAGAIHIYGRPLAIVLPLVCVGGGIGTLTRSIRRWSTNEPSQTTRVAPERSTLVRAIVIGFGTLCLGAMYLQLFSPAALNYDSVWCHLTVAESYAREGGIVAFPGDYAKNVPQLTPLFHLWGFMLLGFDEPALQWMFALHNEFALFLWTLVGVVAAVGWILAEPRRARISWAAFFLFPGIFVYDSNLGGAADHVLAFFALPMFLAAARLAERPTRRKAILLGMVVGGALSTKYQAVYVLFPVMGLLAYGWLKLGLAKSKGQAIAIAAEHATWAELAIIPGVALLTAALVVAPHFLRNFIFYSNPIYPFMQDVFTASHPQLRDGAYLVSHVFTDRNWQPQGTLLKKAMDAVVLFFTFSFKPHYYYEFHHNVPSFGSLFTLMLPLLLLVGRQPRLWRIVACASGSILLWAMTFLVDRNLQTFLPLLVASTAGIIVMAWQRGWIARVGIGLLVSFQVLWGADAIFYSGHERLRSAVEIIMSGFAGTARSRLDSFQAAYLALGKSLPPNATVVLHGTHGQLGINRRVYLDWAGFQGLIDYRSLRSVAELDARFRSLGITHFARPMGIGAAPSKQEDILLSLFLSQYATAAGTFGGLELFAMPATPVPAMESAPVIVLGVPGYPDGAYDIDKLGAHEWFPDLQHAPSIPDVPLPTDPDQWPKFLESGMATMIGPSGSFAPAISALVEQSQTRMRITPNTASIFARRAPR